MKRRIYFFLISLVLLMMPGLSSLASEPAKFFVQGVEAYNASQYDQAIEYFSKVAESGIINGGLFYNLGNAYLKKEDVGRAILWYEKALTHHKNDPDLLFNYQYAKSLVKDEAGEKASPMIRILFFWKYIFSKKTIQIAALIFNMLFWGLLILGLFFKKSFIRPGIYGSVCLAFILTATALFGFYETAHHLKGIVLPEKVAVRSGFDQSSTALFVLHAGTKVQIRMVRDTHVKIYYAAGKMGWVRKTDIGLI